MIVLRPIATSNVSAMYTPLYIDDKPAGTVTHYHKDSARNGWRLYHPGGKYTFIPAEKISVLYIGETIEIATNGRRCER